MSTTVSPVDVGSTVTARRERAIAWIAGVHDEITALFTRLDGGVEFREDRWDRAALVLWTIPIKVTRAGNMLSGNAIMTANAMAAVATCIICCA